MSAITAVGLKKTFRGKDGDVDAVRGVDLDVAPGEVFGFLGPNGAGKSTTVRTGSTPFLKGQNYGAFPLPSSLLLSASLAARRCT